MSLAEAAATQTKLTVEQCGRETMMWRRWIRPSLSLHLRDFKRWRTAASYLNISSHCAWEQYVSYDGNSENRFLFCVCFGVGAESRQSGYRYP